MLLSLSLHVSFSPSLFLSPPSSCNIYVNSWQYLMIIPFLGTLAGNIYPPGEIYCGPPDYFVMRECRVQVIGRKKERDKHSSSYIFLKMCCM